MFPIFNKNKPENHSAEVSKMGDITMRLCETKIKL